jgi:hypothetical protein
LPATGTFWGLSEAEWGHGGRESSVATGQVTGI